MTPWSEKELEQRRAMAKMAVDSNPSLLETYEVLVTSKGVIRIAPGPCQWEEMLCSFRDLTLEFLVADSDFWRDKYLQLLNERKRDE
jgi:hypothetical protein